MKNEEKINIANEEIKNFKTKKKEKKRQKQAEKLWNDELERRRKPLKQKIKEWLTLKKAVMIAAGFIVIFFIFKTFIPLLIFNVFTKKEFFYIKNNNLFIDINKDESIGENIYEKGLVSNDTMSNKISNILKMNDIDFYPIYDKKQGITIYIKNYNNANNVYTISVKKNDKKDDEYEIHNVVRGTYKIAKDNKSVVYEKIENNKTNLYYSDFKIEKIIQEDVSEYYADDMLDKMYILTNGELYSYSRSNNNRKNLIATNSFIVKDDSDIKYDKILEMNDFNNICFGTYTNENKTVFSLYKKIGDNNPTLISDECTGNIVYFENDDYLYYQKQLVEPRKISDYVEDDISNGEFDKTEPKLSDFNMGLIFPMPDYFSYFAAKSEWDRVKNFSQSNKDTFDKYVQQIERGTYNAQYRNLFYYTNGNSDTFCDEKIKSLVRTKGYKPYIFFEAYKIKTNDENQKKQKLSDIIKSNSNISTYMKTVRDEGDVYRYIYHKNEGMRVRNLSGEKFELYESKNKLIIHSISDDKMYHSVFTVEFKRSVVEDAVFFDKYLTSTLSVHASPYIEDIIYTFDYGNDRSYLYVNGNLFEREVMTKATRVTNDLKNVLFMTEYNNSKGTGVLNILKNKEKKQISENVLYTMIESNAKDGSIYYIADFDGISLNGKLYTYDKFGRNKFVDENVSGIVNQYRIDEKFKIYKDKDNNATKKSDVGIDFGENYYQKF